MSADEVRSAPLVRPWWRGARLWVLLVAVLIAGGAAAATLADEPGRPLDPASAHKNGGKALARLLEHYGAGVTATRSVDSALGHPGAAVLVTAPNDYSTAQLRRLAAASTRLVLVRPGTRAGNAVAAGLEPGVVDGSDIAQCSDRGAAAAGSVDFPGDTLGYTPGSSGAVACFGGGVLLAARLAVLGSSDMLRNDHLDDDGIAALDINVITDSRRLTQVTWLLPGADTAGPGPASVWDLFPSGAYRAFWWLAAVAALTALWRARRLGGVVPEPLPVVVRSAEVVEGHGRLYARAGARDRAAAALRSATTTRLAVRLGLPRGAPAEQVAVAAAAVVHGSPAQLAGLLAGAAPVDDAALVRLATELDHLESAVGGGLSEGTTS
ncbi:MAG: DUF4350 domain-containing protein [Jatrophihabitans sp.]|uniref:DUF4350 domain-containing protein n=1 Tax=Jatrophihabitans sp. TaxID=1932789 RepID=UPI0039152243